MGLRPTHLGYAYQDPLTALRLVDLAVGRATSVNVDTKMFAGDRFDDITCEWGTGSRERLRIKHTDHDRALSADSCIKDSRGLRLDLLFSSIDRDLTSRLTDHYPALPSPGLHKITSAGAALSACLGVLRAPRSLPSPIVVTR